MVEGLICGAENSKFFGICVWFSYNNFVKMSLGDWSDGGTPGNIPNPVVKPVSADGTWRVTSWESRSLPRDF